MRFFSRKKAVRKSVPDRESSRQSPGELSIDVESHGHNPYDTLAGVDRERVGMHRRANGKWSF